VLTVENGFATKIEGGVDAELLREYMESFKDPEAYAISHIGWGLQPRAHRATLGLYDREATIGMDARAYEGNFLFSLGPNNEVGGSRTTTCHIDIPLPRMHGQPGWRAGGGERQSTGRRRQLTGDNGRFSNWPLLC
jgi:2,5-dihydroxypyridine 5,6-dioxygenase